MNSWGALWVAAAGRCGRGILPGWLAFCLAAGSGCMPPGAVTRGGARGTNGVPSGASSTLGGAEAGAKGSDADRLKFVVSFPESARSTPLTGRVLLFLSNRAGGEPRHADFFRLPAVYAIDATNLYPGELVTFLPEKFRSANALASPETFDRLPPGTYYAQALFDQDASRSSYNDGPGNLYSATVRCELNGAKGRPYELVADRVVQESAPAETDWVKLVEIRSAMLSEFHGREVKLRAAIVLPAGYQEKPETKFPAVYQIPGFGGRHTAAWNWIQSPRGKRWQNGEATLPSLQVYLDPEVALGHSVFANSANNGPVGDALVRELIPEIERRFRAIPEARGRFLAGHSSGGWASLWLQVAYSDVFGGCWSTAPDPVDFRAFQTLNIYEDRNGHWTREGLARPVGRNRLDPALTFARLDLWERVTGPGGQLHSFNAVFSPRGADGRPRRLMDALSGVLDREVAEHWKRYDLRRVLQENWNTLAPDLAGKIHILAADEDTFYLDGAVELLRDFLRTTTYGGYVEIVPGDHGSMMTEALRDRIEREMAAKFAERQPGRAP